MPFEPPFPRSFSASTIRAHAPASSGVYGISSSTEWIYIGDADDMQAALLEYLSEPSTLPRDRQATGFFCEPCPLARRPARRETLVREFSPTGNRLKRSVG